MSVLSLHTSVMLPLVLTRMSSCCSLIVVLGLRSLGIPFLCSLPRKFFPVPSHQTGQWRKISCQCTFYVQIPPPPSQISTVLWVAVRCCAAFCLTLPCALTLYTYCSHSSHNVYFSSTQKMKASSSKMPVISINMALYPTDWS